MVISRRRDPTLPQSSLTICGVDLEKVDAMKYLGVCISKNLSWSTHVNSVCSKAKRILGLLYRRFYNHSTSEVMLQLYLSLVRPHMEYAAAVWSPHFYRRISRH